MHVHKHTRYLKTEYNREVCGTCQGSGIIEKKIYHNQFENQQCHSCNGSGYITVLITTDATAEIKSLKVRYRLLKIKYFNICNF